METNKRFQIRTIKRTSGRGLKPLPAIEDAPWLNDVPSHPRPVQASPSFVGVEQVDTVPLSRLVEAKTLPSFETTSATPTTDKWAIAHAHVTTPKLIGSIGPKHPLWPVILQVSKRLWHEIYQSIKTIEPMPSVEYVRQRATALLRDEPAITDVIDGSAPMELFVHSVLNEVIGYGPLESLLQDEHVTEIVVSDPLHIMMKRDGVLHDTAHSFVDEQHVLRIIENMLRRSGTQLPLKRPLLDIVLPPSLAAQLVSLHSSVRVIQTTPMSSFAATIILPPISAGGPLLMVRRRTGKNLSISELIEKGTLNQAMADTLLASVKARANIIICGGQATGKTTLLNALAACIPEQERIVCVENAPELILRQRGNISLITHGSGPVIAHSASQVTISEVLQYGLLLHPTYFLLGECRGEETTLLLHALEQGQQGVMTTLYAPSIRACLEHLEHFYQGNDEQRTSELTRKRLATLLDLIIFLSKKPNAEPEIQNIVKVVGVEKQRIKVQSVFYQQQEIVERVEGSNIEHS